ncbi:MAG TPA: NAD-dependent dehydratase [Elusimicrobia bacterium]|nr:NAD-dependent dehydratase [Elusimicrobiota bacterium]HBT60133.1 NAD-dependent dehydratase [Elusimicrobiota bacterium]
MNWKDARVLVTGAGGFIGSHLAEELSRRGAKVRAMVRYNSRSHWGLLEKLDAQSLRRIEVLPGDVTDPQCVARLVEGQDIVFHLAALIAIPYSYAAPASYVAANLAGTLNVLEACRGRKTRKLVVTSTSEVYGTARYVPIDEAHPLQGQSPYSATKIGADHLAESYFRCFGLPVAVIRPFNTFGPRQSARAVIPTIISQLLEGRPTLELGSTSTIRDFNYVADTVEGFLAVAASPKSVGEVINIGSGRGVSIAQTAQTIMRLMGRQARVAKSAARTRPERSEVMRLVCDNRKARRLLGWKPSWSFDEGLARTIDYMTRHRADFKAGLYNV